MWGHPERRMRPTRDKSLKELPSSTSTLAFTPQIHFWLWQNGLSMSVRCKFSKFWHAFWINLVSNPDWRSCGSRPSFPQPVSEGILEVLDGKCLWNAISRDFFDLCIHLRCVWTAGILLHPLHVGDTIKTLACWTPPGYKQLSRNKQMLSISALCLQDSLAVQVHTLDIDRPHPLCPDCVHHLPLDYLSPNLFLRTLGLGCHCHDLVSPPLSTICCNGCGCEGSQVGFNFTISLFVSNGLL